VAGEEEGHKEEDREEAEGEAGGTGWRRWGRIEFGRIRLSTTGDGRDECGSRSRDVRATKQNHGIRERS
jgi:hypothetical protein